MTCLLNIIMISAAIFGTKRVNHMMGVRRLEHLGFDKKQFPIPFSEDAAVELENYYAELTMVGETCSFTRKKKSMESLLVLVGFIGMLGIYEGSICHVSETTTMSMTIVKELFGNCIRSSEALGIDDEFTQELRKKLKLLKPYQTGSKGQLLEWMELLIMKESIRAMLRSSAITSANLLEMTSITCFNKWLSSE